MLQRLGRHMHVTVTAVWRYLKSDFAALREPIVDGLRSGLQADTSGSPSDYAAAKSDHANLRLAEDDDQSLESRIWRADCDLKLEYMFRVLKHRSRLLGSQTLLAADLDTFTREEVQDLPAKRLYFRWVCWVERIADRLGIELVEEGSEASTSSFSDVSNSRMYCMHIGTRFHEGTHACVHSRHFLLFWLGVCIREESVEKF